MQNTTHSCEHDISATAARLVVEEGLDFGAAKHRAIKVLGMRQRSAVPSNAELELAVRAYIDEFCAQTQPNELQALRELALTWMRRLERFHPYLSGAVWRGTATRASDIQIELFCEDPKMAELALLDMRVDYEQRSRRGMRGEIVDTLSVHSACPGLGEMVGVHLLVYDFDRLRGALRRDPDGRPTRGDAQSLALLLAK